MKRSLLLLVMLCLGPVAYATVPDVAYSISFTCTGSTGPFPFTYPISDATALSVAMNGSVLPSTSYTVVPVNANFTNGGMVTLVPTLPCQSGWPLVLTRVTPLTQHVKFYDNMPIPMSTFEKTLDKLTEITQEIWGGTTHHIQFQEDDVNIGAALVGDIIVNFDACNVGTVGSNKVTINCPGTGGAFDTSSPPPIGDVTPNIVDYKLLNGVINPLAYLLNTGADFGDQVNAATAANCDGTKPCNVVIPSDITLPLQFSSTIQFVNNMSLDCGMRVGSDTTQVALEYTGNTVGFNIDGVGGVAIRNCGFDIGLSTGELIKAAGQTQTFENLYFTGGVSGSKWLHLTRSTGGANSHTTHITNVHGTELKGDGIVLDHTIDTYLSHIDIYGNSSGGIANSTSRTLVIESGTGGVYLDSTNFANAGRGGIVIADTVSPLLTPQWLFFNHAITDCSSHGPGILFDTSLNGVQIGAVITGSWASGAGLNCTNSAVVVADTPGVLINGGRQITFVGGNFRANTGPAFKLNASATGRVIIAHNQIIANCVSNSLSCDGIVTTASINGLDIDGNTITNADSTGATGHQQNGIGFFAGGAGAWTNIRVTNNDLSGNTATPGDIRYIAANNFPVTTQWGNTNTNASLEANNNGNVGAVTPGNAGAWVAASFGATNSFRAGATSNLRFDGANWYLQSDGANNGGGGMLCANTGTCGLFSVPTNGTPTVDQTKADAALTSNKVAGWDTTSFTISVPATINDVSVTTLAGGGVQCLHSDNFGHVTGAGSDCGSGGGGGSVTGVGAVSPVASTGGTAPAISLHNSAGTDVTASLGTDTKIVTASGSAFGNGNIAVGDAQGGITDSTKALPSGAVVGTTDTQSLSNKSIPGSNINSGVVGTTYGGTGQNFSASTGVPIFNGGTASMLAGTQGKIIGYNLLGVPTAVQLPVYNGGLLGLTGDNSTDNCVGSAMANALAIVSAVGPAYLQLPMGNLTKLTTCDLDIPANVIILGSNTWGANKTPAGTPKSGLHVVNAGAQTAPIIHGWARGMGGLENVYVLNDSNNRLFAQFTCMVPHLVGNMFVGRRSAITKDVPVTGNACADGGVNVCPDNDGIQFGSPGSTGSYCDGRTGAGGTGDGFDAYGQNIIRDNYFQNMRRWFLSYDNANGLTATGSRGDYTDADIDASYGSPFYFAGTNNPTYDNHYLDVHVEMSNFSTGSCNYPHGVFRLANQAQATIFEAGVSDMGNCPWSGGFIDNNTSSSNKLTISGPAGSSGCVSDTGSGGGGTQRGNIVECLYTKEFTARYIYSTHIGDPPVHTALSGMSTAQFINGGVLGWDAGSNPWACDVGLSRGGTGAFLKLGDCTNGNSTGRLDLTTLNASGVATVATMSATTGVKLAAKTFATLDASPVDGEMQYCSDCKVTTAGSCTPASPGSCVCVGSGTGAFAKRMNYNGGGTNWYCQ